MIPAIIDRKLIPSKRFFINVKLTLLRFGDMAICRRFDKPAIFRGKSIFTRWLTSTRLFFRHISVRYNRSPITFSVHFQVLEWKNWYFQLHNVRLFWISPNYLLSLKTAIAVFNLAKGCIWFEEHFFNLLNEGNSFLKQVYWFKLQSNPASEISMLNQTFNTCFPSGTNSSMLSG